MTEYLAADGGSFKDPAGRVYRIVGATGDGRIARGLNQSAAGTLAKLLAEPFFRELTAGGQVVTTRLLDPESPTAQGVMKEGWSAAAEHESVDFVSWPYEWSFSMLRDAALLQLHLLETGARNGWLLKDATPFNVQWKGGRGRGVRPVFIDVPSFVRWKDGEYWRGYRQFCATFLTPLLLTAHLGIPSQPLLRSRLEGIPPEEASRYFYGLRRFRRGVPSHIWFPAWAGRGIRRPERSRRRQPKTVLFALLDSLRRLIGGLSCGPARSDWARYAESHSYDAADFERKKDFVRRQVAERRPGLTWDLGANTGAFARIAAEHSGMVVAVDADHDAVDLLYREMRQGGPQNVLPLVMDLANLSPGQGWAGRERMAFDERRSPDLVLCLALIHHMRVAANIPLPLFLGWLRSLDATCIVEFVGRDDEMFQRLVENRQHDYADYTAGNFESEVRRHFSVRDRVKLKGGLRELFVLEPVEAISRAGGAAPTAPAEPAPEGPIGTKAATTRLPGPTVAPSSP